MTTTRTYLVSQINDQEISFDPKNSKVTPFKMPRERMMEMINRMMSMINQQEKDREEIKDLIVQHLEEMPIFRHQQHSERQQTITTPLTTA